MHLCFENQVQFQGFKSPYLFNFQCMQIQKHSEILFVDVLMKIFLMHAYEVQIARFILFNQSLENFLKTFGFFKDFFSKMNYYFNGNSEDNGVELQNDFEVCINFIELLTKAVFEGKYFRFI